MNDPRQQAIDAMCEDCMIFDSLGVLAGQRWEDAVKNCPAHDSCALWPFRPGADDGAL